MSDTQNDDAPVVQTSELTEEFFCETCGQTTMFPVDVPEDERVCAHCHEPLHHHNLAEESPDDATA